MSQWVHVYVCVCEGIYIYIYIYIYVYIYIYIYIYIYVCVCVLAREYVCIMPYVLEIESSRCKLADIFNKPCSTQIRLTA